MELQKRQELEEAFHNENGQEILNPVPMTIQPDELPQRSLNARIQDLIAQALSNKAAEVGMETIDEADDFDIQDDFESEMRRSKYELMDEDYHVSVDPTEDKSNANGKEDQKTDSTPVGGAQSDKENSPDGEPLPLTDEKLSVSK